MAQQDLGKTSTGIQPPVAALLAYVVGWVTGLIFYLIEKENKFVRFHAMQSIVTFGAVFVAQVLLGMMISFCMMTGLTFFVPLFSLLQIAVALGSVVAWILLMIKAAQGESFKLPILGEIAEKQVK